EFAIPLTANARGCDGLRVWGTSAPSARAREPLGADLADALPWLRTLPAELLLFVGKGGVGKSTCASASALALAEDRAVSLYSTDPAGSLADVLGAAIGNEPVQVADRLEVRQVDAQALYTSLRDQFRRSVDQVFERIGLNT